jgi:NAD(P)-dependent dehydrogenase (short-subunit alcohol dehydrogenase family)
MQTPMTDLAGTRVVVTGGTSGLGRAMAEALAAAGARVAITSRQRARAVAAADELGAGTCGVELDVRDEASVDAFVEEVYGRFGEIDMLVNNAGIGMITVNPRFMTDPQPFWELSTGGFRDVVETKFVGSFLVARAVARRMLTAQGGRIVTISMNEHTMTREGFVPYGPSGAAVDALARVMAEDLAGTPVTANILLPGGGTATGMLPEDVPAEIRAVLLDPAIMGPPIVWLASSAADGVHGERIVATTFDDWLSAR